MVLKRVAKTVDHLAVLMVVKKVDSKAVLSAAAMAGSRVERKEPSMVEWMAEKMVVLTVLKMAGKTVDSLVDS